MNLSRAEIPLYALAVVFVAAIVVLILTGHAVPTYLYGLAGAVLAGGLGIANPSSSLSSLKVPTEAELQAELAAELEKFRPKLEEAAVAVLADARRAVAAASVAPPPPAPAAAPAASHLASVGTVQ